LLLCNIKIRIIEKVLIIEERKMILEFVL